MTTLISFLGKGVNINSAYQTVRYRFDETSTKESAFFGMALAEYIHADRLLLIGTAGSMWDVFIERESVQPQDSDLYRLMQAVETNSVNEGMLEKHAKELSDRLGYRVNYVLADYAKEPSGQIKILQQLADQLQYGEHVSIDVTHSFRHLPMLALVAAQYLSRLRGVVIDEIYYGALQMKESADGDVPVLRLSGMLQMLEWVEAFSKYDKDGDYSVFADLLEEDGMSQQSALSLKQAAFRERVNHTSGAREKLSTALNAIENHQGTLGALFKDQLLKRFEWMRLPEQSERELKLASDYFDRQDYLRCSILLIEGLISRQVYRNKGNLNDRADREIAEENLKDSKTFERLKWLRNSLAHGQRSRNNETAKLLNEEQRLRNQLRLYIQELV